MASMTSFRLTFVTWDSLRDPDSNGSHRGVRSWAPGTSVTVDVATADNADGTTDEFAAEEAGRTKLSFRGLAEEDYSLEELEILDRYEEAPC